MYVRKTWEADLRAQYRTHLLVGLATSLLLMLLVFRLPVRGGAVGPRSYERTREEIPIEEVLLIQPEGAIAFAETPGTPDPGPPVGVPDSEILAPGGLEFNSLMDAALGAGTLAPVLPIHEDPPEPEPGLAPEKMLPGFIPDGDVHVDVFVVAEEMPQLITGLMTIQQAITYPEEARRRKVEGRVIVQFLVNERGYVSEVRLVRGIGGGCDEMVLRAVEQAYFGPIRVRGRPARVRMSVPVSFRMEGQWSVVSSQ